MKIIIDISDDMFKRIQDDVYSTYDGVDCLKAVRNGTPYDDTKYHEEHGEVIIDKDVWEDAKKAVEQHKTGHWIATENGFECSECGCISRSRADVCQYCGEKMVEPQERSEMNDTKIC